MILAHFDGGKADKAEETHDTYTSEAVAFDVHTFWREQGTTLVSAPENPQEAAQRSADGILPRLRSRALHELRLHLICSGQESTQRDAITITQHS
jgi:hypothetical protein